MGLLVDIFRCGMADCTNNGISKNRITMCVVNVEGPFSPADHTPAALLESHIVGCLRIVPAVQIDGKWVRQDEWWMFGGNYAATSDSRFAKACEVLLRHRFYGAVAIHDRKEP